MRAKLFILSPVSIAVCAIIVALLVTNTCMAQEVTTEPLCPNSPQAYTHYSKGKILSNVGWGLFGGGLAMTTTSIAMGLAHPVKDEVLPYHHAMNALFWTGNTMLTASIPILIVGYVKQHKAADANNSLVGHPQPYVSLNVSGNGLGLAYNF